MEQDSKKKASWPKKVARNLKEVIPPLTLMSTYPSPVKAQQD